MATLRPCFLVALALSSLPLGSQAAQGPWRAPRPRPVSEIQGVPIVPTYSVIQMDTLDGNSSAYDLDPAFDPARPTRRPVVVGGSVELGAGERAVGFREEGTVLDLGVFAISRALGVNSSGTIVGQAGTRAFRFARGAWALLPDLGGTGSVAEAVSEDGIAVGHDRGTGGGIRALYWTADGQGHVLPTGFGSSGLVDVNRRNVAAGTVFGSGGAPRFAFTMPLGGRRPTILPAPFPGASGSFALAINDRGDVVGAAPRNGAEQPVLWSSGVALPLEVLPDEGTGGGRASDINNHGVVVGNSNWGKAVVWIEGAIHDLNELTPDFDAFLTNARAINDQGVIVCDSDAGGRRAVLLIPRP